jgi:hypothetical protein
VAMNGSEHSVNHARLRRPVRPVTLDEAMGVMQAYNDADTQNAVCHARCEMRELLARYREQKGGAA